MHNFFHIFKYSIKELYVVFVRSQDKTTDGPDFDIRIDLKNGSGN
jgi:hypothetical protein